MVHPDTELRFVSDVVGVGLFATRPIPLGTIVWVQDDLDVVLEAERVAALDPQRRAYVDTYAYRDQLGRYVLCWDHGRFVNHSFHANCMGTAWQLEVAIRDIAIGEELTDDYGTLNLDEPFDAVPEAGTDRERALPDDVLRYADRWDESVVAALRHHDDVDQPLAHLVRPEFHDRLRVAVEHGVLLDSISTTRLPAEFRTAR